MENRIKKLLGLLPDEHHNNIPFLHLRYLLYAAVRYIFLIPLRLTGFTFLNFIFIPHFIKLTS